MKDNADRAVIVEPVTVSVEVAAQMLGVSRAKAYELIRRGDFRGVVKLGRRTLVSVAALREWVENRRGDTGT